MDYNSQKAARHGALTDWLVWPRPRHAPAGRTRGSESRASVLPKPATQCSLALPDRLHGGPTSVPDAAAGPEVQRPELQLGRSGDAATPRGALPTCRGGEPPASTLSWGGGGLAAALYAQKHPGPSAVAASGRGVCLCEGLLSAYLGVGRGVE